MSQPLLKIRDLKKYFPVKGGLFGRPVGWVRAIDGVSFEIFRGEAFGLVGESGSGKTTLGQTVLRMHEKTSGLVEFDGLDVHALPPKEFQKTHTRMQYIFQDPYSSLNPRIRIGDAIAEPMLAHGLATKADVEEHVVNILTQCGLATRFMDRYPHEFSGGQRQRIVIARAMALNPEFIVADEPVSSLDVSIQAQIINLFSDLQEERKLTYLFISHDLGIVEHLCSRIAIMYLGSVVELATRNQLFSNPIHPYTKALLSAVPVPDPERIRSRIMLSGDIPSPQNPPPGCPFHTRCPYAKEICREQVPEFRQVKEGHQVACHLF